MSEQNILATIDGVNITEADVDAYIAKLPQEQQAYAAYPQFRKHCLDQILAAYFFAKYAEEEKLNETEEYEKQMAAARKDILAQLAMNSVLKDVAVTEEEMKNYYEGTPQDFTQGETVSAKHILVAEEEKCNEILEAITNGSVTFEDAAKEFSSCPSNAQGGSLGEFGRGQMVPEFDQAAFAAEVGVVVGPVKTQFGYHLIKVEEKKEATVMTYDEVKDYIYGTLMQRKQNEVFTAKYKELYDKYMK